MLIPPMPMKFDPVLGWMLPGNWMSYIIPPTPLWFWDCY